jgi:hypothetical protein
LWLPFYCFGATTIQDFNPNVLSLTMPQMYKVFFKRSHYRDLRQGSFPDHDAFNLKTIKQKLIKAVKRER